MKKITLFFVLFTLVYVMNAQDYAVLRYGSTDSETLSVGDAVYVPVIVDEFTSELVYDFMSSIEFDDAVLNYDSITDLHPNLSNPVEWVIANNGTTIDFIWTSSTFCGVPVYTGDTLCTLVFVYNGGETGLSFGEETAINIFQPLLNYTVDGCVCANPTLPAIFHVSSNSVWLEDASITIELETQQTDSMGISVFNLPADNYSYVVSKAGYEDYTGSFEMNNSSTNIYIEMVPSVPILNDYQCILPNSETFFQSETAYSTSSYWEQVKHLVGIKVIDSVLNNYYTSYLFYHEFYDQDYTQYFDGSECILADAAPWCGDEFQVYNDGMNVFFNRNHDSIFIKTNAVLGDSWTFFNETGNAFIATVIDISEKEFLGISDMVKTIEVSGSEQYTLELSQHYGLTKTINFRDFPDFGDDTYDVYQYNLKGLSNPAIGFQKMTTFDIYDYEIGDEIHWTYNVSSYAYDYTQYYIDKYLNKEIINQDTIQYSYERTSWYWEPTYPGTLHTNTEINVINIKKSTLFGGKLPFENISVDLDYMEKYIMYSSDYNDRTELSFGSQYIYNTDNECFTFSSPLDGFYANYIQGIGYFYYEAEGGTFINEHPVHFSKGDEDWGTPLTPPMGISENESNKMVLISPNPANSFVNFILIGEDNGLIISIFNLQGKMIYEKELESNSTQIDVKKWNQGMYFYQVRKKNTILNSGKFVVQ